MRDWDGSNENYRRSDSADAGVRLLALTAHRGRVEEFYRTARARRDHRATARAAAGAEGRAQAEPRRHAARTPGAHQRGDRRLPGVHRNRADGHPEAAAIVRRRARACSSARGISETLAARVAGAVRI